MYDAREKARRDRQTEINDSRREGLREGEEKGRLEGEEKGEAKGEVKLIRTLEELLDLPPSDEAALRALDLEALRRTSADLQKRLRERKGR